MLKDIKQRLLENADSIINILEAYGFYKPHISHNEIRCGLYEGSNPTAIHIRLLNNDGLFVTDYVRNIQADLIDYIIKVKESDFKTVLSTIKKELKIDDFYNLTDKKMAFGGFYNRIAKADKTINPQTYDDSILDVYDSAYNLRFLRDRISFEAQKVFNIGYDVQSDRITIPIYNAFGELIGVKGRANWDISESEPKYLYLLPCAMSGTLYGLAQNYSYLNNNEIWIFESEKSVLQCYSYGIRQAVALGCNSLSREQCKLLMQLNPTKIVFMLDKGLDIENTYKNIEKLSAYTRMSSVLIEYWAWIINDNLPDKASPSDYGKDALLNIMQNEIVTYRKEDEFIL